MIRFMSDTRYAGLEKEMQHMLSCDWHYRKGIKPITENCRTGDSGSGKGWAYKKGTEVA